MAFPPVVTSDQLAEVAAEAVITDPAQLDCRVLGDEYQAAMKTAEEDTLAWRVYRLMMDICLIHLKPADRGEPFGPMFQSADRRSAIPSDFKGRQSEIFAAFAPSVKNPALRARLSDIAWSNHRHLAESGRLAVNSYLECIDRLLSGTGTLRYETNHAWDPTAADLLRRAIMISIPLGREKSEHEQAKSFVRTVRQKAYEANDARGYWRVADLDLDFSVSPAEEIGREAEALAESLSAKGAFHEAKDQFEIAERAYRYARDKASVARVGLRIGDCLVAWADSSKHSAMTEAHWLQKAIGKFREVPGTKDRRKALQDRLNVVQLNIRDEMGTFSHETDISDMVDISKNAVSGKSFIRALGIFACLDRSPDPNKLRENAAKSAKDHPLMALITASVHDDEGKLVGTLPGVQNLGDPNDEGLIGIITREASMRRSLLVSGGIEPARQMIGMEHALDEEILLRLMTMSGFVPPDREYLFAKAFMRFFGGDFVSSFHILYPQLENSLRYILKQTGFDPSTIKPDLTQESITLSALLEDCREQLESVLGPELVMDIDLVFTKRGGPTLRHSAAHGLMDAGSFFGPDVIYACWLMFRMSVLPMLSDWSEVERRCTGAT